MTIDAGEANVAPFTGLTIPTAGNAFNTTATGADTVVEPRLSDAFAVNALLPAGAFVHVKSNGALVLSPTLFESLEKYSTFTTEPSGSLAFTVKLTLAGVSRYNC